MSKQLKVYFSEQEYSKEIHFTDDLVYKKMIDQFYISLTKNCNQRCFFCNEYNNDVVYNLDFSEIIDVLDIFGLNRINEILLTGGEPTIHKDFARIVNYLIEKKKYVSIYTNGIFLFKESFLLKHIQTLSQTNLYLNLNYFIFNQLDFNKFLLKNILSLRITPVFILTSQVKNKNIINKLLEFLHQINSKEIIITLVDVYSYKQRDLLPTKKDIMSFFDSLYREKQNYKGNDLEIILDGIPYCMRDTTNDLAISTPKYSKEKLKIYYYPDQDDNFIKVYKGFMRAKDRIFINKCQECIFNESCHGFSKYFVLE